MIRTETGTPGSFLDCAPSLRRAALNACLGAAALLLAGCVAAPNGGVMMGLDTAAVFGDTIDTFRLQDGSEGVLRRDRDGVYSVKLEGSLRVLQLEKVRTARIARVENVGARTVVLLETERTGCRYKYDLLAIQGGDVLQWGVGNCSDRPRVALAGDGLTLNIDFPKRQRLQRIAYSNGRVLSKSIAAPAGVDPALRPFADAGLRADATASVPPPGQDQVAGDADDAEQLARPAMRVPTTPSATTGGEPSAAGASITATPRPAATGAASTARRKPAPADLSAPPNAALSFPTQEIPATHLDLRK